jgi:3-hydroxyacyl-CoA dehydrogenase
MMLMLLTAAQVSGSVVAVFDMQANDLVVKLDALVQIDDVEINDTLAKLGLKRRDITDEEILERMVYPMINEGARILEEKIAARPSDIDVVWLYGYGWPIYRGGPMHYADSVGLKHIAERLSAYAKATNDPSLEPAPLLARLAAEGKTFASLTQPSKAAA